MQLPFWRSTPVNGTTFRCGTDSGRTQVGPLTIDQRHHGAAKDAQTAGPDFLWHPAVLRRSSDRSSTCLLAATAQHL